ncbi:hypothetical protein BD779DRAFT_1414897, partial [Infundibulicybe gibba]
ERLAKLWTAPIYAFFQPIPAIEYVGMCRSHFFTCAAKPCRQRMTGIQRYLDKGDANSTSNLRSHAKKCWGADILKAADTVKTAMELRQTLDNTDMLDGPGKCLVSYSHRQHSKIQAWAEIVRWVAESMRPFDIVSDHGFQ